MIATSTVHAKDIENGNFEMVNTQDDTIPEIITRPELNTRGSSKKIAKDISWADVNFSVDTKSILSHCWGRVDSGKVCAIMGPSGAGKSSLLNVLAGRSSTSSSVRIEGLVTVGGSEINPVMYRENIAYVMQDDALMATATPREALRFSATMRLPSDTTSAEIESLVTKLLEDLGLTVCADVLIGGALIKGISGGQRKRTSVGVEVITSPTLLFLDEPTSGLDSFSAFNLVTLLKKVARENCTILCTIHQPSSEVFFLFDTVIYMKDGRIFYQGPVDEIVPYYSKLGCVCPDNYNPSDFVMNLAQSDTAEALEKRGLFMDIPTDFQVAAGSSKKYGELELDFVVQSSFLKQVGALTRREATNVTRDIAGLVSRFGVTILLNLLFGLIFLNVGDRDNGDIENFNSHVGALSMVMIFTLFGSAQQIMLSFPFERPMFLREFTTGTYKAPAYFLSKIFLEIPLTFVQMIVQYLLVYYMMGFKGNFILMVLASFGLSMVSNSVAMALGCMVPDVKDVTELAPLLFVPQLLFGGFFVRTGQIPVFLRWAQYLCGMKYGMNLVLLLEFGPSLDSCSNSADAITNCHSVLDSNGISPDRYWIDIVLLFGLFLVFRLLAGVILVKKAKKFY